MNHLLKVKQLSNLYFVMRHGQSLANLERKIVSFPENGIPAYGLSDQGKTQVIESGNLTEEPCENLVIISSDFKRARESAEIMHRSLNCTTPIRYDERLRERNFGDFELGDDSAYESVWREDRVNADNRAHGVESSAQVMTRVTALVCEYEEKEQKATLLLVSHGDALQILQTAFLKQDASKHRMRQPLETAEIRRLILSAQSEY